MKNRRSVETMARHVRAWALDRAGVYEQDLCGWCGICSAELWRRLTRAGIHSRIHVHNSSWESHVFLVVDDHIVDVTATQFTEFRQVPVVIIPEFEGKAYSFYSTVEIFDSAMDLRQYQLKNKWPKMQVAFKG